MHAHIRCTLIRRTPCEIHACGRHVHKSAGVYLIVVCRRGSDFSIWVFGKVPLYPGHLRSPVNTHDLTDVPMTVTERPGHARSRSCYYWAEEDAQVLRAHGVFRFGADADTVVSP
jgi:hypothetical protein